MNRDQTEEWRGWMQLIVLAYHYTGGSKIPPVYAFVRLLVGAYLFMTGYGHASFFFAKNTYPPTRLVNLMLRLNLLPLALSYAMDAPYLGYYFSPLVSFWFLVLWIAFSTLHTYNGTLFLPLKLIAVWSAVYYFHAVDTRFWFAVFGGLRTLGIDWDAREWCFRVALDCWAPLLGVATAWVVGNWERITPRLGGLCEGGVVKSRVAVVGGVVGCLAWGVVYGQSEDKFSYNARHPWISLFPIMGFVALRNATVGLRKTHAVFWSWVGKISLETFILQFHIWLAMDTRAILVYLPGLHSYWPNLLLSTLVFLYISEVTNKATGDIVDFLITGGVKGGEGGMWRRLAVVAGIVGVVQVIWALAG